MPQIVGLTGGIATGKSTVSAIWAASDIAIIDADAIARQVVQPGRPALRLIRARFGASVLNADGTLNRAALGSLIFSDPTLRKALNARIHPFIIATMFSQLFVAVFIRWRRVVVLDAPLLFESATLVPFCTKTVVVACEQGIQIERLLLRDAHKRLTHQDAVDRINSQMPLREKIQRADLVIDNSGDEQQLRQNALRTLQKLEPSNAGELAFRALVSGFAFKMLFRVAAVFRNLL